MAGLPRQRNMDDFCNQAFTQACAFLSPVRGTKSVMAIWTKPLARRTLPRVRGAAVFTEAIFFLRRVVTSLLCQDFPSQQNSAVGVAQAIKWRIRPLKPHTIIYSPPHPPQPPAASSKSSYRKCLGETHLLDIPGCTAPTHVR